MQLIEAVGQPEEVPYLLIFSLNILLLCAYGGIQPQHGSSCGMGLVSTR